MKKRTMNRLILLLTATLFTVASLKVVAQRDKWGAIDRNGNILFLSQYDEIREYHDGLAVAIVIIDPGWPAVPTWKFCVIDKTGKEVVPLSKYNKISDFCEGMASVENYVEINGQRRLRCGFIDKTGKLVVPPQYDEVRGFSEGYAALKIDGKWGFINKTGKEVVSPHYDHVKDFSEGLAAVEIDGKWGYIDKTGGEVLPPKYISLNTGDFKEGLAAVKIDNKWGVIDKNGKVIIHPQYDFVRDFHEGLAVVGYIKNRRDGTCNYGVIDKTGKVVVPIQDNYIFDFSEGIAIMRLPEEEFAHLKFGFIDKTGKQVVPLIYDRIVPFCEGMAVVGVLNDNGQYISVDGISLEHTGSVGVIDKTGKLVVPLNKYSDISTFSEGLSAVEIGDKYGYIDKTGNEVIPPRYDFASSFNEGLAIVVVKSDDITLFEKEKKRVQETLHEFNQQLKDYPYNIENLRLEPVSLQKYFLDPRLETITDSIVVELKQKTKDLQDDCYKRLKSNHPEKFAEIYLQIHPEASPILENLKLECRCKNYSEAELVIKIADNVVPQCTCRSDYWNQYGTLFSSRAEFDNTYNTSEQGFLDEVNLRQRLKADIQEIASMLAGLKSAKFKDGLTGKQENIIQILQKVQYHQGKYYYDEVLEMMFAADAAMTKEWEKNGQLFNSKREFYEAYVSGSYKDVLKEKKSQ